MKAFNPSQAQTKDTNQLGSQIVREIVIPELTTEVNENKNFARLRQVYNSLNLSYMVQEENQRQYSFSSVF